MNSTFRRAALAVLGILTVLGLSATPAAAEGRQSTGSHDLVIQGQSPTRLAAGLSGPVYIVNKWTGRCLDAWYSDGGGNGNRVGLWDCNGGISEKWYLYNNGSSGPYWLEIINARTGRSLDYPASSGGANGYQYLTWDYMNSTGQRYWPYLHTDTNDYEISVELGGGANVMDAFTSDGGGNGNRVGNWSITNHPAQRWTFVAA
ncbi:hypothetical protein Lfu02_30160 [Longispora fulva]|uniref:Ricin B lectin domain-containing protein n=1 Tax=Longispora fulva TaxID=619741 RepID=A0A8J7KS26_9ACTN|nr:RICIN domain-containing protein [Longispora fulva]MBG6139152.1 hypothetical protein [Longispora fulva]GIG58644.1 hypothetical protein Lfu02_30160 [Longispora fulva]